MPPGNKSTSKKTVKKASTKKKPAPPKKIAAKKAAAKKADAAPKAGPSGTAKAREKKLVELFGPSLPKGKGVNAAGETMSPTEVAEQGWCLMQFPPPEGRMSWIYTTHGLSTARAKGSDKPTRVELVVYWREKHTLPLQLLNDVARYILETGNVPEAGQLITAEDAAITVATDLARHCVTGEALGPGKRVEVPGGSFTPIVLLGISDAELEFASRVRPDIADGKQVLIEALRIGGVFPVTDPKRLCLTRRRDFNKVWEAAFRTVRERKA